MNHQPEGEVGLRRMHQRTWWLLAIAFGIRFALALLLQPDPIAGDEAAFERLGRTLALGRGFVNQEGMPTAYHAVGYPALIAALYSLFGEAQFAVRLLQALLSTCSLLIFSGFAARAGGDRAKWKALILGTVYPADLLYLTSILPITLTLFLGWLLLLLLDPWFQREAALLSKRRRLANTLLAGLVAALLLLVHPATLLLPLLLWGWVIYRNGKVRGSVVRHALLALLIGAVPPALWVVRNDIVVGERTLSTGIGAAFYVGNHPSASGGDRWFDIQHFYPPYEKATQRLLLRSAFDGIGEQPWSSLVRISRKWAWTLRSEQGLLARRWAGYEPATFVDALESTPIPLRMLLWFFHAAVFTAGWSAWWFAPRGPWRGWSAVIFLYVMGMAGLFYGAPVQHALMLPPMMLAAVLLPEEKEGFIEPTPWMAAGWAVGFLFAAGVWLVEAVQIISL